MRPSERGRPVVAPREVRADLGCRTVGFYDKDGREGVEEPPHAGEHVPLQPLDVNLDDDRRLRALADTLVQGRDFDAQRTPFRVVDHVRGRLSDAPQQAFTGQ